MPKKLNFIGLKFNKYTVLSFHSKSKHGALKWLCRCDCGNTRVVLGGNLGRTIGCCTKIGNKIRLKHGFNKHPLYAVWASMKQRCYTKSCAAYRNYGAIGISVCDEWRNDVSAFIKWALDNGWQKGLELDKDIKSIRGEKPKIYSPDTCMFVTKKENLVNRNEHILEFRGKRLNITQWAQEVNLPVTTLYNRIRMKQTTEEILTTPYNYRG